jgi:hypothetical protein
MVASLVSRPFNGFRARFDCGRAYLKAKGTQAKVMAFQNVIHRRGFDSRLIQLKLHELEVQRGGYANRGTPDSFAQTQKEFPLVPATTSFRGC